MNNFNFSVIEGNLIEDPKKLGDGYVFKISSTRTWRDKYGNNKEEVTFFDVMVKDKLWKNCYKYLKKNTRVLVSGHMINKNDSLSMLGKEVNFIGGKS